MVLMNGQPISATLVLPFHIIFKDDDFNPIKNILQAVYQQTKNTPE